MSGDSKDAKSPLLEKSERLSLFTKIAFGLGYIPLYSGTSLISLYFNPFLLQVALVKSYNVGTIIMIGSIWDAISDPIVGRLADKTESRWGRRRPWLLFGALPFGVFYFLLWLMPEGLENLPALQFAYYLITLLLYKTAQTVVGIPHTSLTPELTSDYNERTSLMAYKMFIGSASGIILSFLQAELIDGFKPSATMSSEQIGYMVSAGIVSVVMAVCPLVTFFGVKERYVRTEKEKEKEKKNESSGWLKGIVALLKELQSLFQNFAFVMVTLVSLTSWVILQVSSNNALLFVQYVLKKPKYFSWFILCYQVVAALSMIIWSPLSKRIGKQKTYYIGKVISIVGSLIVFFVPPGQVWLYFVATFLNGLGVGVVLLIPWAMLPDVMEYDELLTGQRREGLFYSVYIMVQKLALALALAGSNYALGAAGFETDDEKVDPTFQPDSVLLVLRILMGIVPTVFSIISSIFVYFYPITKERHEEIKNLLEEKKTGRKLGGFS